MFPKIQTVLLFIYLLSFSGLAKALHSIIIYQFIFHVEQWKDFLAKQESPVVQGNDIKTAC